jgi:hypothetical protein
VFLNGVDQGTVDLYSPVSSFQDVLFEASDLPDGTHTLRIVHTGEANPSASNSRVEVDAIEAEVLLHAD